jgi:hypothetical protein
MALLDCRRLRQPSATSRRCAAVSGTSKRHRRAGDGFPLLGVSHEAAPSSASLPARHGRRRNLWLRSRGLFSRIYPRPAGSSVNGALSSVVSQCSISMLAFSGASSIYAERSPVVTLRPGLAHRNVEVGPRAFEVVSWPPKT